ncbi:hypothetical protein KY284_021155 [Solanum tuberosum]|nr:hypothetical protein KY284_021155 [Solanum tuberosum]
MAVSGETGSAESPVVVVDHHRPLFLQASDTPGAVTIPIKLTGLENYTLWSRSVKLALQGKGKLGFINGTCAKHNTQENWLNYGISIGCTIVAELMPTIMYASHDKKVWIEFKERFVR